jgi:hypothetical protein
LTILLASYTSTNYYKRQQCSLKKLILFLPSNGASIST